MASASVKTLKDALEYWNLAIANGEKGGKLSAEAALTAQDAGATASREVDGLFSSDEDEAMGFWAALDVASEGWIMYSADRGYLSGVIRGQLSLLAKTAKTEAEASYSSQVKETVSDVVETVSDTIVETGKDPSGLWAAVGGGLGFAAGTVLGAGVGGPFGAAAGGAVLGFVGGKLKSMGIL